MMRLAGLLLCLPVSAAFSNLAAAPRVFTPGGPRMVRPLMVSPPSASPLAKVLPLVPGLTLTLGLAVVSERAAAATALSPLLWATLFGMVVRPSILLSGMLLRSVVGNEVVA